MSNVKLNRKQQIFVNEYLIDFNGTRSAKAAGYSERSAYSTAHEILRNPEVKEYLEQQVSEANELAFLERQRVISKLKEIAYGSAENDFLSESTASDRLKALLLLGKAYGLFWDKPEIAEEATWVKKIKQAMIAFEEIKAKENGPNFQDNQTTKNSKI